jgi:hypothetical protein
MKATGENARFDWRFLLFILLAIFCLIGVQTSAQDYSACEQVLTNEDQLASVFTCDVFCLPSTPPDFPAWLIDPQFLWADFAALPNEFSAALAQSKEQVHGITVLKLRLTRWILSGETTVEVPFSTSYLTLAPPAGYDASTADWATRSAMTDWQQWIDWGELDPKSQPTLRLTIALANVQDRPAYNAMIAAEDAAFAEASALASLANTLMSDSEDSGGDSLLLLSQDGTPCGASKFNKLQVQGTNFFLEWYSQTNATYEIVSATDMTVPGLNWTSLASQYPAASGTNLTSFVDTGAATNKAKFYKVAQTGITILMCQSNTLSDVVDIPVDIGMPSNRTLAALAFVVDDEGSQAMTAPPAPFTSRPFGTFDTTLVTNGWHTMQAIAKYPSSSIGGYDIYTSQVVVVRTQNHVTFPDMLFTWGDKLNVRATLDTQVTNWTANIWAGDYVEGSPSNHLLRTYSGITSNGQIDFVWDGKDSNGVTFAAGMFTNVTFLIDDPKGRPVWREGNQQPPNFFVSYMRLTSEFSAGSPNFVDMISQIAQTVAGSDPWYALDTSGGGIQSTWEITDTRPGWNDWATKVASNQMANLFYFGHASENSIGNRTNNSNSGFYIDEIDVMLGNIIAVEGVFFKKRIPKFLRPYHFVFLDGCEAAKGNWCEAFGIQRKKTTSAAYTTNGVAAKAFLSAKTLVPYAAVNAFSTEHRDFVVNLFQQWSTQDIGLQQALNMNPRHTVADLFRIWGAQDLKWQSPDQ